MLQYSQYCCQRQNCNFCTISIAVRIFFKNVRTARLLTCTLTSVRATDSAISSYSYSGLLNLIEIFCYSRSMGLTTHSIVGE